MSFTPTALILLLAAGCTTHAAVARRTPPCRPMTAHVIDEAGRPVPGARVHTSASFRQFGPSGLPEASFIATDKSPVVETDVHGNAAVCDVSSDHAGQLTVDHLDWPQARGPVRTEVTIGPGRAAFVQVPLASTCNRGDEVRVTAYAEPAAMEPVRGIHGPTNLFTLAGLGPWRYWVRSEACGETVVRVLDGRKAPPVLTMDRNESVIEFRNFAGGTATVFRDSEPVLTETLPADGIATLALPGPSGAAYCLMLQKDERCLVTYTRVGEVARPFMYLDRRDFLARDCPVCPAK